MVILCDCFRVQVTSDSNITFSLTSYGMDPYLVQQLKLAGSEEQDIFT